MRCPVEVNLDWTTEGMRSEAYTLFSEAFSILQQVTVQCIGKLPIAVSCHGFVSCRRHGWCDNATAQGTDNK
nr:hypothetical protein CFP56_59927 [Quercus suber]